MGEGLEGHGSERAKGVERGGAPEASRVRAGGKREGAGGVLSGREGLSWRIGKKGVTSGRSAVGLGGCTRVGGWQPEEARAQHHGQDIMRLDPAAPQTLKPILPLDQQEKRLTMQRKAGLGLLLSGSTVVHPRRL